VRDGGFPRHAAELERIDGIGPFTAAIIASFAFREQVAAIDTNVRRVLARLAAGDVAGELSDRDLLPAAQTLLSTRAPARWNQAMMDLGGRVCLSRAPRCDRCPVARWCRARPLFASGRPPMRVAERRARYRPEARYEGSRRYYRGRIVEALRRLPQGRAVTQRQLLAQLHAGRASARQQAEACPTLQEGALREIVASLRRDGLVRVDARGRLRLP
jgi:A/G-specific adenine glycosylase